MKKMISIERMIELENWIKENDKYFRDEMSEDELSRELKLKVEYLESDSFPPHTEAELGPCDDLNYNGLIRINKEYAKARFVYIHEIIHYLYDVGVGKRVSTVYARKTKGNTIDEHEQEINYASAAVILKLDAMKEYIQTYDCSKPKMDELRFVNDICVKYHQDRTTVIRRIREVRALMKAS